MNILIVGNGGREHALVWKLLQSRHKPKIYVAPGNAGTAQEKDTINVDIAIDDIKSLLQFAKNKQIDLTIIGPELPLSLGIIDEFENAKLTCIGPNKNCAKLESSKTYSKKFMKKYNIPTANYQEFNNSIEAKYYIENISMPIVIKVDGLASGKGVVIAKTKKEAFKAINDIMSKHKFGKSGSKIVIEEFLAGEEASFIVLSDGLTALSMASSQDHKTLYNGDIGPNTGGMGAYSPAPIITRKIHQDIMKKIINPTIHGMKNEGTPYKGFLYAGLMIMPNGELKTLEFNCRLGDPETQPIIMRLESDLVELLMACVKVKLKQFKIKWKNQAALGVIMSNKEYPHIYPYQEIISGLNSDNNATNKIFHCNTYFNGKNIVTCGGRIICATALGNTVKKAHQHAYALVKKISWNNKYYRDDIGNKAFKFQ